MLELEKRGYSIVHETARVYIDREMAKGKTLKEIRNDELVFQKKVLLMKIDIEKNLLKEKVTFLDRGIPDSWAYDRLYDYPKNPVLEETMKKCSYKKVFLLDQLPYELDYARTESKEMQDRLHGLLKEAYMRLNMEIIEVPVFPMEERQKRADFILKNL